jgi:DNA-binding transcriptional LysR family regulator
MPAELNGEPFVAFDPGLTIRKAIDRALRQHGVRVSIVMEFDNIETIKQAIIIASGVSILPRHTVQKEASIRTLAAVDVAVPGLVRPVGIVHHRQKPLAPTAARFVQLLQGGEEAPRETERRAAPSSAG